MPPVDRRNGGADTDADADGGIPEGERPDAEEVARRVRLRRVSRQLKAAASLLLAAAAGTFLACVRRGEGDKHRPNPAPNPTTDEISNLPAPPRPPAGSGGAPGSGGSGPDGTGGGDGSGGARGHRRDHKHGHVDRDEHRKGMPVPDNLLE